MNSEPDCEGSDNFSTKQKHIKDRIAMRAYEIFESCGCEHGHDREDWLQAEKEILFLLFLEAPQLIGTGPVAPAGKIRKRALSVRKTGSKMIKSATKSRRFRSLQKRSGAICQMPTN